MIKYEDYTIEETDLEGIKEEYDRVIEESNVEECLYDRGLFVSNSHAEEDKTRRALEMMGSKIISASDVESNRELDYRFWQDEKEFRKYKESQNVIGTEREDDNGEEIVNLVDLAREKLEEVQWTELIDLSNRDIVKALIQSIEEASEEGSVLNLILHKFYYFLRNDIKLSKNEKEIIGLIRNGLSQNEISEKLSFSRAYITQSINRLSEKVINTELDISDIIPNDYQCLEAYGENNL